MRIESAEYKHFGEGDRGWVCPNGHALVSASVESDCSADCALCDAPPADARQAFIDKAALALAPQVYTEGCQDEEGDYGRRIIVQGYSPHDASQRIMRRAEALWAERQRRKEGEGTE